MRHRAQSWLARWLLVLSLGLPVCAGAADLPIVWHPWSKEVWAQAKAEHKLVLLDLEAVWCHWCHVMDATTYQDPAVAALIREHYLAVKVDQDSRPDLANRYEDYGWPATVIYDPDGGEIIKKQGYIPPAGMLRLLTTVAADPSPDVAVAPAAPPASASILPPDRRTALRRQWLAGYDEKGGGWGTVHKFLDWDSVELAMREAQRGDRDSERRARTTLRLERKLLDPVWGGVYQYSIDGWDEPHFEKIMAMQAENMRIYALAYAQWRDPADLAMAQAIRGYIRTFWSTPSGAFYTSQDADAEPGQAGADYFALPDAARRARGLPRIDRHQYARENGWAITGLAQLAAVTDDGAIRQEANNAAWWARNHRILPGGGFSHDAVDVAGPYLGDTLAMGRSFFALYEATAYGPWLDHAAEAVAFIQLHFRRQAGPGFATSDTTLPSQPESLPEFDENVALARLATAVGNAKGNSEYKAVADSALRWLLSPGLAEHHGYYVAGLLLAEEEARTDPLHIAVVGPKNDGPARSLYRVAVAAPTSHKLIEWWDPTEGLAPRDEDIYPSLSSSAAFVCDHGACSAPIMDPATLTARLKKLGY
jgi:uncharacterized protein YyaL (SSP411 family)